MPQLCITGERLHRICKSGDAPQDYVPHLVHDLGGYLLANVDYFVNTNPDADVKKADDDTIEETAHSLMVSIDDSIKADEALPAIMRLRPYFEAWAKKD